MALVSKAYESNAGYQDKYPKPHEMEKMAPEKRERLKAERKRQDARLKAREAKRSLMGVY